MFNVYGHVPVARDDNRGLDHRDQKTAVEVLVYQAETEAEAKEIVRNGGFIKDGQWHVATRYDGGSGGSLTIPADSTVAKDDVGDTRSQAAEKIAPALSKEGVQSSQARPLSAEEIAEAAELDLFPLTDDPLPENSAATVDDQGRVATDATVEPLDQPTVDKIVNRERDITPAAGANDDMPGVPRKIVPRPND